MLKKFYFLTASALIIAGWPSESLANTGACQVEQQRLAQIKNQRQARDSIRMQSFERVAQTALANCLAKAGAGGEGMTGPTGPVDAIGNTGTVCKPCNTSQMLGQVRSLQTRISSLNGAVKQRDQQIRQLKAALNNVPADGDNPLITKLRQTLANQTTKNNMLGSQLSVCEGKLAKIDGNNSNYITKIRNLNSQIATITGNYTKVKAQRDSLAEQLAIMSCESTDGLETQINQLQTLNTSLKAERDSLTAQLAALTGQDTGNLESQIAALTSDNVSKGQTILVLEREINTWRKKASDLDSLKTLIGTLRRQNKTLQARISAMEECKDCDKSLIDEIDQLKTTNQTLDEKIIVLERTISTLRDNPDLSGQVTVLTNENQILVTRIDRLQTDLAECEQRDNSPFDPEERDSMLSLINNMNLNLVGANETIDALNEKLAGTGDPEDVSILLEKLNDRIADQAEIIRENATEIDELKKANFGSGETDVCPVGNDTGFGGSETGSGETDPDNHPPVVMAEDVSIVLGKTQILELVKNDTDQDGDDLVISNIFNISKGINVTIMEPDRKRVLVETIHNPLSKSFEYEVSDGRGGADTGKVEISLSRPSPLEPLWPWASLPVLALAGGGLFMAGRRSKRGRLPKNPLSPDESERLRQRPKTDRFKKLPRARSDDPEGESNANLKRGMVFAGSAMTAGSGLLPPGLAMAQPVYDAVGRVGYAQKGVPMGEDDFFGTGILISDRHLLSNRHVWEMFKHKLRGGNETGVEFFGEKDSEKTDFVAFSGEEPIFIDGLDAAIFTLSKPVTHRNPVKVMQRPMDELDTLDVVVVGYPQAHRLSDEIKAVVEKKAVFGVKRFSEGKIFRHSTDIDRPYGVEAAVAEVINGDKVMRAVCHDASTLGGSSGSAVIDKKTGDLIALHFGFDTAYDWEEAANFAIAGEMLSDALERIVGKS